METSDRRRALALMAAASGAVFLGAPARLAAHSSSVTFFAGNVRLRRELSRELGGGEVLTVIRDWEVGFRQEGKGAKVVGRQRTCQVDAPPALAGLAAIERERIVTGLFPMSLAANGLIVGWADSTPDGIADAVERASDRISDAAMDQDDRQNAARYFAEIGRTAAEYVSQVPRDLFYPRTGTKTYIRELKLEGGLVGTYEVTTSATARPQDGLLDHSERRIVTRIGNSARVASERWKLIA